MKLPGAKQASVRPGKVTEYLLSASHPNGRHKAHFFRAFGFSVDAWQVLEHALLQHAKEHYVFKADPSPFGVRYVIDGKLCSPDGRNPKVRTVWFIESGETIPYFVTAYPIEEKQE